MMPSITVSAVDTDVCRGDPEPIKDGNNRKDRIVVKSEIHSYEYQVWGLEITHSWRVDGIELGGGSVAEHRSRGTIAIE